MLLAVVFILEIVDCNPLSDVKGGAEVFRVTARPADEACMAGELLLEVWRMDGLALLRLVTEGEFLGPGELVVEDGELWRLAVTEGEVLIGAGDGDERCCDGDALMAGDETLLGRQCLTESDPDWESLLLLGDPGEDTITCRGLRPPAAGGPTRGESGR